MASMTQGTKRLLIFAVNYIEKIIVDKTQHSITTTIFNLSLVCYFYGIIYFDTNRKQWLFDVNLMLI
jgi:hypothetical protein